MQDCLDGGILLLIRCPGFEISPNLAAEKLTVDAYITSWELVQNKHIDGDITMLVQAFCQEFAVCTSPPTFHRMMQY